MLELGLLAVSAGVAAKWAAIIIVCGIGLYALFCGIIMLGTRIWGLEFFCFLVWGFKIIFGLAVAFGFIFFVIMGIGALL